jgi:hypothetical protein
MLESIPPAKAGDTDSVGAVREAASSGAAFRLPPADEHHTGPPPEVLHALDRVQRTDHELRSRGLSVSFDLQPQGGVRVSLVNESGELVQELSPSEALEALSGEGPIKGLDP